MGPSTGTHNVVADVSFSNAAASTRRSQRKAKKKKQDGLFLSFTKNSAVLVNKQNKPIATRIKGPITQDVKKNKFMKLVSLSSGFL